MLAVYILLVLVGYAIGRLHTDALYWARADRRLPPATPRAIARAAKHARLRLCDARPAREVGVRATSVRLVDRPPARFVAFDPLADVDEEHTRG